MHFFFEFYVPASHISVFAIKIIIFYFLSSLFPIKTIKFCFLSQAFLLLSSLLSQAFPLLLLLLLFSCHKHVSCYGCFWCSFLFSLSHQTAIAFFVGGVSQAAARQGHQCAFLCVVLLRQFRQAIFFGLL